MSDIVIIALLCVYSVILIFVTYNAPSVLSKIKQRFKNAKRQKQTKLKKQVRIFVREYLKELSNEK